MTTSLFSFFHSPLALIVSQTLLHFLWQGTLISLLAAGASHVLRKRTSTLRYGVFCFVFLLMAACPIVTFYSLAQRADSPTIQTMAIAPPTAAIPNVSALAPVSATAIKLAPLSSTPPPSLLDRLRSYDYAQLSPYVLAIYLAGVLMNLFRLIVGLYGGKTLRCTSSPVNDRAVLTVLARQVRILGLGFTPAIAYSRKVLVPTVVGVLRPMILIPAALATNLTPDQVEALLTHELAHLSRYDHLVNLLQRVIEAFEFFHPGVWYVSKLIRAEREHCCDDRVLAAGGRAASYASSLVEIAELCLSGSPARTDNPTALTLATQKSQLHHRVLRLLGVADHEQVRLSRPWMIIAVLFITITTAVTIAASHKTEKVSAVSTSPKYKNNVVFVNIDDFTSDTNGATGDMGPTGKITCGHPGAVSQVTWKFLTTSSEGDVYEFSRVFPSDTATPQTTIKQITYSGQQQVIFQDKVHRVIIKPKPIPSSQPGKKVSIKAVVFSVPRDADLSFLNEFIGQKQLNPYRGNLSQEQTADLLTRLRSIKDMQILSRPQITAYEHQHATIQIGQTVPWVQPNSKQVYSIDVGLQMGVTAAVNSQGGLNAELELTKTLIKSSSNPQQPDILQNSDNVSAFIPDNHSLLVEMSADHLVRMVPRDKIMPPTRANEPDFQKEPIPDPPQPKERFFFLLTPIISISSSQPATQLAGQGTGVVWQRFGFNEDEKGRLKLQSWPSLASDAAGQPGEKKDRSKIIVEARFIKLAQKDFETLIKESRKHNSFAGSMSPMTVPERPNEKVVLTDASVGRFMSRLSMMKSSEITQSPRVVLLDRMAGEIQMEQGVLLELFDVDKPRFKRTVELNIGASLGIRVDLLPESNRINLILVPRQVKMYGKESGTFLEAQTRIETQLTDGASILICLPAEVSHWTGFRLPTGELWGIRDKGLIDVRKEPVKETKLDEVFLLMVKPAMEKKQPATQPAGQDTNGGLPASNGEPRLHEKAMGRSPTATTLVLQILGPDGRPVAGARVGTQVCTVEGLDNISMNWDLGDNQTATESDNQGQVILAQEDLFRDQSPEQQDNVIYVLQKDRRIGGWFKIARKDFGKHIPLTLQTVCRVYGNFDSKGMRELGKPLTWSGAVIGTGLSSIMPLQYISKQRHFEFFLPPGSYNLMTYGGAADKQVRSDHVNTYYTILDGRQELDLGTIDLPPTKFSTILGKPAPELQVREWKNSSPIRMADLRGKVVLFYYGGNLLSSRDLSALAKLHEQFKDRGLVVFALYMFDSINQLQAAFTKNQAEITGLRDIPFPVGLDVAKQNRNPHLGATADAYGIAYSDTLLIDRNGNIVGRFDLQNGVQLESLLRINSSPPATQPAGQGSKDGQPTSNAQR